MTYAVLFPGQGSQSVGMCADVRAARPDLFSSASDVLGWDLDRIIADGPEEKLTSTEYAQPALFVTSYALWTEFRSLVHDAPAAAAGHSLGEYTALAAAEVVSFDVGVSLVAERGEAMSDAAEEAESGMAALIGASEDAAQSIALRRREEGGNLYVANINAPDQIVVAGGRDDLAWLADNARELGIRRSITLKVAGGFHSPFMASASQRLESALDRATFRESEFPVVANATAAATSDPRRTLADQLISPVRFAESIRGIASMGIDTFVHVGPGNVTTGLVSRCLPDVDVRVVSSLVEARSVAEELSVE